MIWESLWKSFWIINWRQCRQGFWLFQSFFFRFRKSINILQTQYLLLNSSLLMFTKMFDLLIVPENIDRWKLSIGLNLNAFSQEYKLCTGPDQASRWPNFSLVAFISWDIWQYEYCNCLITRLWLHKFWNSLYLSNQAVFST